MSDDTFRSVEIERTGLGTYTVRNPRGGSISIGSGQNDTFTPVELLLAAIGGCTAVDVDHITSRRAEPDRFTVEVTGEKIRDEAGGNRMRDLRVEFTVTFPEGADGDRAREALPRSLRQSHDRLCTVSRTVQLGTPVTIVDVAGAGADDE
ncbi:OsmC family protein [Micromonospora sp. RP3T]|uniref:OsmC family protein n=1 Tax=Micromonospora sp. RP3T TaxID=2135446 RepID=UPI003D71A744